MIVTREHLAGLELARSSFREWLQTCSGVYGKRLDDLIAQAKAPPVAEPVAWQVRNGVCTHGFYKSEADARKAAFDAQKTHDLSGSLAAFNVRPVCAAPPHDAELVELLQRVIDYYAEGDGDLKCIAQDCRAKLASLRQGGEHG